MVKRRIVQSEIHRDVLIKSHSEFKKELDIRLEIGKELIDKSVTNHSELQESENNYNSWDDYNAELLKQSFDRPNNDYHSDYTHSGFFIATLGGGPSSFNDLLNEHKSTVINKQNRLQKIRDKVDLIETLKKESLSVRNTKEDNDKIVLNKLENLFSKFHRIAQTLRNRHGSRDSLIIKDEYDVQDLLRALLKEHFDDVRDEDYVPSYAGSNSRVDFVLKNEKIIIEVKMTNDNLKDKETGNQLLIDISRYKNHPDCGLLVLFIYDKADHILNKLGLISDLNNMSSSSLKIRTYINPT